MKNVPGDQMTSIYINNLSSVPKSVSKQYDIR